MADEDLIDPSCSGPWLTMHYDPLRIDGPAYVDDDACSYRLGSVGVDGTCHLYNAGTCVDADGTIYCVWPMIRRTANIGNVRPDINKFARRGNVSDLVRLLQHQHETAIMGNERMLSRIYGRCDD